MSALRAFRILAAEAFRDGLRRRLALAVAIVLVLGLASAQSCSQLGGNELTINESRIDPRVVGGFVAPLLFAMQALAVLAIAGLVAADHLARPLAEGGAVLWLARPVSRATWVLARLAGALAVAGLAGVVLLGGSGALLVLRQGVAIGPALQAAAATALGSLVVAALAMAGSLALGRIAVVLLVWIGLFFVVIANGYGLVAEIAQPGVSLGGVMGALDRFGPPLFRAIAAAVAPWNPHVDPGNAFARAMTGLALWAAASIALLVVAFRRREIES